MTIRRKIDAKATQKNSPTKNRRAIHKYLLITDNRLPITDCGLPITFLTASQHHYTGTG